MNKSVLILLFFLPVFLSAQIKIAQLKYEGGGDWYSNPSSLKNLIEFVNDNIDTKIDDNYDYVDVNSKEIFDYPYINVTGHGNIVLSSYQIENLRKYLNNGGFIHFDDNYGMYKYIKREVEKIFPKSELKELPLSHKIFNMTYKMNNGLPKVHVHDGKKPRAMAIFIEKRMVLLITQESDLSDGWEDESVHNDPQHLRTEALKMGSNIIEYVFTLN